MDERSTEVGSLWLRTYFKLSNFSLTHQSYIGSGTKTEVLSNGHIERTFGIGYATGTDTPMAHWEFALKYDHLNLPFFKAVLSLIGEKDIKEYIQNSPTGKYARKTGFLYEFLLGKDLGISITMGNYVDLLDDSDYITSPAKKNTRWRINNNLLGNESFCPVVRRSETLNQLLNWNLSDSIEGLRLEYSPETFLRAVSYLYTKETKSSYEIEHEKPSPKRIERFISLLKEAGQTSSADFLQEQSLTSWQNSIVDPRYAAPGFRDFQNYVGETFLGYEKIHYVCPPPEIVDSLMHGLHKLEQDSRGVAPMVRATLISFGFVFIHPFEDGNGRLHRFLIHDMLVRDQAVPNDVILPVSARILSRIGDYDKALEAYSKPLGRIVDYNIDTKGEMNVKNGIKIESYYRYPDLTAQVIYLLQTIQSTVLEELPYELSFIQHYDELKSEIQDIVDMPDKDINLMIVLLHNNRGNFPKRKRKQFDKLTDDEIARMEDSFKTIFLNPEI